MNITIKLDEVTLCDLVEIASVIEKTYGLKCYVKNAGKSSNLKCLAEFHSDYAFMFFEFGFQLHYFISEKRKSCPQKNTQQ